jgi:HD-GYP domain-containing protein (c-di-GMP phosphodiesterase class II)
MRRRAITALRRLLVPMAAVLFGVLVAIGVSSSGILDRVESDSIDARFSLRSVDPPDNIVVVQIGDEDIDTIGRWPFRRTKHAIAVDRLRKAGARLIVYDVQFTEESENPDDDWALYDALGRAGGGVLATSTSDANGHTHVLGGERWLKKIHARAAAANLPAEEGGIIRRYEPFTGKLASIAVVAARRVRPDAAPLSSFPDGHAWIDFRGRPGSFPTLSFADVIAKRPHFDPSQVRGKIVVIGASAPTLQDRHPTPTSGEKLMAGPEIQANAIWTALHDNPLRDGPGWIGRLAIALLALLPPLGMIGRRRFLMTLLVTTALAAGYAAVAMALFTHDLVVPFVIPLVALIASTAAAVLSGALLERAERRRVSRANLALKEELNDAHLEIVRRLAIAAESHDDETGGHIERISHLTHRLALAAGLPAEEAELIRHASLMHDVGKIATPDAILRKPGKLTDEEWVKMRQHTVEGARILQGSRSRLVQLAETIALSHHEKWDGSGYPNGVVGEAIPISGRITAVCDVFDALVSKRVYKGAWTMEQALDEIRDQAGRHFDPRLVEAFMEIVPDLPRWLTGGSTSTPADAIMREAAKDPAPTFVATVDAAPAAQPPAAPAEPTRARV